MRPNLGALGIPTFALSLLACSLFARPTASPPPGVDGAATATLSAGEPSELPTPDDPSPTAVPFVVVDAHTSEGDLAEVLAFHAGRAAELGLRPFVEFTAAWCPSCNALAESLDDPLMIEAFQGTYLVRLDIDEWDRGLPGSGFRVFGVPTFFEIDDNGEATGRTLTGAAWGRDVVENMAPVLKQFFAGD